MKVALIFRSKERNEFSIENVFEYIKKYLNNNKFVTIDWFLPRGRYNRVSYQLEDLKSVKRCKADIYHITGEVYFAGLVTPGNRTIITMHDYSNLDMHKGIAKFISWLFWDYIPLRKCRYVTCISQKIYDETIERFPFTKNKIFYVPDPVDDSYQRCEKTFNTAFPQILVIGTRPNKNLERIVEAVKGINCKLYIIGKLNENQISLINRNNIIYEAVHHIPDKEVLEAYINSDIVCFPSTYEGFGMPIIEGNAIGRVVLTSNIAPMTDVGANAAYYVNPYDVESIRSGIKKLISDKELRETLINNGFENVYQYRASAVAKKYTDIYEKMI